MPTPKQEAVEHVARLGVILGIWAHPDDEAYLSAATMRLALGNGQRVVCVTATDGGVGSEDGGADEPSTRSSEELAQLRRSELEASLAVLAEGGRPVEHHWLGWPDGGCSGIDAAKAAGQLGSLIDSIRPDTILTFDPAGITGHPDHRAVAEWVSIALATRDPIVRLDAVVARSWTEHLGGAVDLGDYFDDGYPQVTDDSSITLNLVLDDELWAVKDRALRAHASQVQPVIEHLGTDLWRAFSIVESFVLHAGTASNEPTAEHRTAEQGTTAQRARDNTR